MHRPGRAGLPSNAPDNSPALELVEQSETNTSVIVEAAHGPCRPMASDDSRQAVVMVDGDHRQRDCAGAERSIQPDAGYYSAKADWMGYTTLRSGSRTCRAGECYPDHGAGVLEPAAKRGRHTV